MTAPDDLREKTVPMECNACAVAAREGRYYTAAARVFLVVCPACGSDDVWERDAA